MIQIDTEWSILAVFQLFQYFPTKVSKTIQNGLFWLFCNFSNIFLLKLSKLIRLICCPTYRQSQRLHIAYTHVSLLYLCTQKEQCHCNLFSEIYDHILFTSHLNFTCILPLSCVFLANYVPKWQMSLGPYGPIFILMPCKLARANPLVITMILKCVTGFPLFRNHKIPGFFKEFDAIFQVYFCIGS